MLLAVVESRDEVLEEPPHGGLVAAEVAEGGAAGLLVDHRAPVEEPAHREQVMVDSALASQLDLAEGVPLQANARYAVEPSVGGADLAADGSVQCDPGAQQAAERCAQDAVGQDVHRQLLEVARGPGARAECTFGRGAAKKEIVVSRDGSLIPTGSWPIRRCRLTRTCEVSEPSAMIDSSDGWSPAVSTDRGPASSSTGSSTISAGVGGTPWGSALAQPKSTWGRGGHQGVLQICYDACNVYFTLCKVRLSFSYRCAASAG